MYQLRRQKIVIFSLFFRKDVDVCNVKVKPWTLVTFYVLPSIIMLDEWVFREKSNLHNALLLLSTSLR